MNMRKILALAAILCSPLCVGLAGMAVPKAIAVLSALVVPGIDMALGVLGALALPGQDIALVM